MDKIKVAASGIDTLVIGFEIQEYLDTECFEMLTEAKEKAGERMFNSKGYGLEWFGVEFSISARGSKGYEWVLRNADVTVCIAREAKGGSIMPEVYVTFSSQNLWANGPEKAVSDFTQWLLGWAVPKNNRVSRADLCLDMEMPFPVLNMETEVVTHARVKAEYLESDKLEHYLNCRKHTGYKFGQGDLSARIYDKTLEITLKQKEWMREIWKASDWDTKSSVIRFEFQCRRHFLKEMGVTTFTDLMDTLADIWRYCTSNWLRICDKGSETNQARWESKDYWQIIQQSFNLFGQANGVIRMKAKQVRYDHLIRQIRGCMVSAVASLGSGMGSVAGMVKLKQDLYEMFTSEEFKDDIAKRQGLVSNIDTPSNHLLETALKMGAKIEGVEWKE
ncbi:hypothetical protein [Dehalococcoides sp. UCH007]|uniref:hypothetical protein n=1 Tax=Dehalococcoides sp. UCH007 TaxID=1522671 RepID=UPI0005B57B7D|nr:hypothetical protein [Dehalococcoides sp. UCH007]BAQ34937.1 hypothetical protein UCH007_09790 [Dehalococcoides sp. UCH007]